MHKQILLTSYLLIFIISCSTHPFATDVIMFDKEIYAPTIASNIIIYNSRLDIPKMCYEIGTIEFPKWEIST